jgi:hypothetical protein
LYRFDDNQLTVRLGDLGSAGEFGEDYVQQGQYSTTYPFWGANTEWQKGNDFQWVQEKDARSCVVYLLAHLVCELYLGRIIQPFDGTDDAFRRAQEARTMLAGQLRDKFPTKPYSKWLLVEEGAVNAFWDEPLVENATRKRARSQQQQQQQQQTTTNNNKQQQTTTNDNKRQQRGCVPTDESAGVCVGPVGTRMRHASKCVKSDPCQRYYVPRPEAEPSWRDSLARWLLGAPWPPVEKFRSGGGHA